MQNKLAILLKRFQEPYIKLAKVLDCPVFCHEKTNIACSEISLLPAKEAFFYRCDLLVLDLWSLNAALDLPQTVYIYMCISPSSWKGEFAFEFLNYIFMSSNVRLIAGNQQDSDIIERCWKKPFAIADDFHIDRLKEILCQTT